MCGIFCSLARHGFVSPDSATEKLLRNRGPDSIGTHHALLDLPQIGKEQPPQLFANFLSTVLSLRGTSVAEQPLRDAESASVLCWNGEAWSVDGELITGNDSQRVFEKLSAVSRTATCAEISVKAVSTLLSTIRGPYAFVHYDARHKVLYYGRDCLGRRSLLTKTTSDSTLILSSVCDNASGEAWAEVEADGVYLVDMSSASDIGTLPLPRLIPHQFSGQEQESRLSFTLPFPAMNREVLEISNSDIINEVYRVRTSLQESLQLRTQHVREAIQPSLGSQGDETRVAILFSGGLDCTILARMYHDLIPIADVIDLLNVAFENPRIHSKLDAGVSPYELCPDRITGRSSHAELTSVCPGRRWNFVEINVPYSETVSHRATVMTLMHPHNTEMDLSISYALYFASRGVGLTKLPDQDSPTPYTTPAHVLLSGLGADELFGGYQRHATAFARHGYTGLMDELELDFNRLGKRNLGRDDRVISDSSKEVRFPYLDENFIALALQLPVTVKCDFGSPQAESSGEPAQLLEPGKRILRLLAWHLGMKNVAEEKKRAIQFGARTAKMETGKTKGTHLLT
ncbi:hypothetical protein EK21DRAFT_67271 [Setomelanomma holmii]|uniref:Glutamine amidotransferase type-2 domain-containing protein n=1 Tax=Setomelanomma holmii TaxID=210430 RepID=A0A9P4HAR0_9PLEO|nr:hypothetical protein EK21DRAFT_67271 [Setomelanomma holmii]